MADWDPLHTKAQTHKNRTPDAMSKDNKKKKEATLNPSLEREKS